MTRSLIGRHYSAASWALDSWARDTVRQGRLRAAVGVTDPEPLGPGHPLWEAPGLLITPHVAASTPLSAARSAALVRAQAGRFIGGQPLQNVIAGKY
jgi:phosphoglycerate dehydrogenase-like enzyme